MAPLLLTNLTTNLNPSFYDSPSTTIDQKSTKKSQLLSDSSPTLPPRHSTAHIDRDRVSSTRARHLERNRIAANKCRQKKKQSEVKNQSILDAQLARNAALRDEVVYLKEELFCLKNALLNHVLYEGPHLESCVDSYLATQQQESEVLFRSPCSPMRKTF